MVAPAHADPDALSALLDHVLAVQDPGMRFLRLMASLQAADPAHAIQTLDALRVQARGGSARARATVISLGGFENVRAHLSDADLKIWTDVAAALGSAMAPILRGAAPRLRAYAGPGVNINELLEDMPLGRRKSLARLRDRAMLDRLRHDKHPAVVALLLQNPRLVESDVVLMAATRPTSAEALKVVARHPRWSRRYTVRTALCQNPYTPPSVGLSLLPTLMVPDLRALARSLKLHPQLRRGALDLLGERGVALREATQRDREAANVSHLGASLSDEVDAEGSALARALMEAEQTAGTGPQDPDAIAKDAIVPTEEVDAEAEAFLSALSWGEPTLWRPEDEGEPRAEGGDRGDATGAEGDRGGLSGERGGSSEGELAAASGPRAAKATQVAPRAETDALAQAREDALPGEDDAGVQALAHWFIENLGPIELVPVSEATDEPIPLPSPEVLAQAVAAGEISLDPDADLLGGADDAALSEEDAAALDFLRNLGEIRLVPVGAAGSEED